MNAKLIKNANDYELTLDRISEVMDAKAGSSEFDELEVLTALVELYEEKEYPIGLPNSIDAIKFRMEQLGLSRKDLIPVFGSRNRASEVLNGKRPLTLKMMRALNSDLGISADVLLQESGAAFPSEFKKMNWSSFPLYEMAKRKWIPEIGRSKDRAEEVVRNFISAACGSDPVPEFLFRRGICGRYNSKTNHYGLLAWCIKVIGESRSIESGDKFNPKSIDQGTLGEIARLSNFDNGPLLAQEYLAKIGVKLVVVPHLSKTYLDGVSFLFKGEPVIGLTLRHDRIDNYWYCLLHELAHVARHLNDETPFFVDDLDARPKELSVDQTEQEADEWAQEALIPGDAWQASAVRGTPSPQNAGKLARELRINPAIVAGRVQFEKANYRLLSRMVGRGEIRKHFAAFRS